MELARFGELEEKVKEIIKRYSSLKDEHEKTRKELAETQEKIAALEKDVQNGAEKKKEALDRVDELIKLLESAPR